MRPPALLLLILSLLATPALSETWTEVQSPHFRVLTDGSARDARTVANGFEQMRYVFALRFGDAHVETGAPLTILATSDAHSFSQLEPQLWKARGNSIAGEFHRGWEKQFAVIRLDSWLHGDQAVVYHEYTHSILHANAHWLPVWLDEGLAELYAYTRFQNDRIYVGAPSERMADLRGDRPLLPVTTMLDVTPRSPYYRDQDKVGLFYAEAWALVHFMNFGPGMDGGKKLIAFFTEIQTGTDQQKAFRDTFGDPHAFDTAFSQYVHRFAFLAGVLPPDHSIDQKTFTERKLTPAEVDYELGCFHIGAHDLSNGRPLIEKALALDPSLAGAHEELGFLLFQSGQDAPAQKEWQQAVALDPSRPRSLFALAMSGAPLPLQSPDKLRATQQALRHITTLAPRFAPPYVELALIEWRLGYLQQAYTDAHQAETLEPWRAGYHILTGNILLHGNQPALAATDARYVANHWFGPDHNEAVDLWLAVPQGSRGDGPALALDMPPGTEVLRGTLTDVSCAAHPGPAWLKVTLQPDKPPTAPPLTFTSDGRLMIGFSDTFWWGEDHFTTCHHLSGRPAVLAYRPNPTQGNQLLDLEVHDDLPNTAPGSTAASAIPAPAAPPAPAASKAKTPSTTPGP